MKVRKKSGADKKERKLRRARGVGNVVIICMLCALIAITAGAGGAHSIFAISKQDVIYGGRTDTNAVAVMINVYWGEEYLPQMLETLEKHGAKATFFIGGCWADDNNALLIQMAEKGHEIGNHGYFHKDGDKLDLAGNVREIRSTNALISAITGTTPKLFAPPSGAYGQDTLNACEQEGMRVIMWSKDTIDWRDKDADLVYTRATQNISAGDTILMHPTEHTANALGKILQYYESAGLKAVTVSEILPADKI